MKKSKYQGHLFLVILPLAILLGLFIIQVAQAGPLDPSGGPDSSSTRMYSLEQLYELASSGKEPVLAASFTSPASGPGSTMRTLNEVCDLMKSKFAACTAVAGDVLASKYFFATELTSGGTGSWGATRGTIPDRGNGGTVTPGTSDQTIAYGYWRTNHTVLGDPDLAAGNIKSGTTIFGVLGTAPIPSGDAVVGDVMAGKTFSNASATGLTGTIPTQTISDASTTVNAGYYAATDLTTVDPDLATGNIRAGQAIFGVAGKTEVVDTTTAAPIAAGRMKTGDVGFANGTQYTGSGTKTLSADSETVEEGYYAATTLSAVDPDLAVGNIRSGTMVFGLLGTAPIPSGDAAAGDVLAGKTFSNAGGTGISGTMVNQGTVIYNPTTSDLPVAEGYHSGSGRVVGDPDLASANIRAGINLFSYDGDPNVVNTSSGDAANTDILSGKKAWVDGSEVTGNIPTRTLSDSTTTVNAGYYEAADLAAVDPQLAAENISNTATIFGIAGSAVLASGNADVGDVLAPKTFSKAGSAGLTGTMTDREGDNVSTAQAAAGGVNYLTAPQGYYDGDDRVSATDAQIAALAPSLVTGNIKDGETVFGVLGSYSGGGSTGLPKTSQQPGRPSGFTPITGEDAYYSNPAGSDVGFPRGEGSWANYNADGGRFTDNGDGTISDNATGLMWPKDGVGTGCNSGATLAWAAAITWAEGLEFAEHDDWRMPNRFELESILDLGRYPHINSTFFSSTRTTNPYWSSSTCSGDTANAWYVHFNTGVASFNAKTTAYYVRPVRGGL